ncbi:unnamed protein product [Clonostachys rhizophaga]|uniref:Uncharacterized protein n=1 Tax=Clonostachys rhizophaga TaxID=160324 RepID=A0A9N9VA78_9HYPO|nr:unnamed protein product [Clonostachys rhizophaga]
MSPLAAHYLEILTMLSSAISKKQRQLHYRKNRARIRGSKSKYTMYQRYREEKAQCSLPTAMEQR